MAENKSIIDIIFFEKALNHEINDSQWSYPNKIAQAYKFQAFIASLNAAIMYVNKGELNMIYKVYYQESMKEIPVRENTKSLYLEASSEREVRQKLKDRNYNIELVQLLEGNYLEYEQSSPNFVLENI